MELYLADYYSKSLTKIESVFIGLKWWAVAFMTCPNNRDGS